MNSSTETSTKLRPKWVRLDVSTVCQLKCPACPTGSGELAETVVGSGFLSIEQFRDFVDKNQHVRVIEMSNWGEVLLNPDLLEMLEYAYSQQVTIRIQNGVNLNFARPEVLEGLVKYRVEEIVCSIDGTTQEVYEQYRVTGNLAAVLANIDKINQFKRQYESEFPRLVWQYIVFGHNEHQIETARKMAEERNMSFRPKLNFDDLFDNPVSPVRDREYVRTIFGVADRAEYAEKNKRPFLDNACGMLWHNPQINFDGEVLGCCINNWQTFGNAFESSLDEVLNGETMTYARALLKGEVEERDDVKIACTNCNVYAQRKKYSAWVAD